ncbi:MAG: permease [Devosia sp.]|nr:permease [Devosia sp.]
MNRITPLVLAVALFMENMDATVIATSLAAIATDIGTEPIALKLALTAYLVALAIFIPVSSWMADRFGSKNVFRWAILVFILGSIACAFANSLLTFVAARFLQGMGGAMMTPIARLMLVRATPRNQLVNAMAWLTIPGLIGPIVGPPFGGFLTTFLSWHWIFLINVPIGLIGMLLVGKFLPETRRNTPRGIDLVGFFLAGTAFALFAFGLSVISLPALPPIIGIIATITGIAIGAVYARHAFRVENPILDLRLFRFPFFRSAVFAGTFFRLGVGATPFLFPLLLQIVYGMTPFQSGSITFATAVGALVAKFPASWIFRNFGFRAALVAATGLATLGIIAMAFYDPVIPLAVVVAVLLGFGFAQSIFWTGASAFVFADIDDKDSGQANVISQVWGQLNFALGVALGGGVLEASHLIRGGEIDVHDFQAAFLVCAAVCTLSTALFLRLPKNAGSALHSHPTGDGSE